MTETDYIDRRYERPWVVLAGIVAAGVLAAFFLNGYQNWGDDWAQYLLQARALLDGRVREYAAANTFMVEHSSQTVGPTLYPWGLPLLLAAESGVAGFSLATFKVGNIVLLLACVWMTYVLARRVLPPRASQACALVLAFNPLLLHYPNHVLTEIPFMAATLAVFVLLGRGRASLSVATAGSAGALAFLAFLFRTNGVLMLVPIWTAAWSARAYESTTRRAALRLPVVATAVFMALAMLTQAFLPGGGESHLQLLEKISAASLRANAGVYFDAPFYFFTRGHYARLTAVILWPVIAVGAFLSRRSTLPFATYILASLALFVVWPAQQGFRFTVPLAPMLLVFLCVSCTRIAQAAGAPSWWRVVWQTVPSAVAGVFLVASVTVLARGDSDREAWHPYDEASQELFAWVRRETPPDAVVAFFKPRAMHLLGERLSITEFPADVRQADYLVYTKQQTWNEGQKPFDEYSSQAQLTQVFDNANFVVYCVCGPS